MDTKNIILTIAWLACAANSTAQELYTVDDFAAAAEQTIEATTSITLQVLSSPNSGEAAWDEKYQALQSGSPYRNGKYVVGKGVPAISTYDASFTNDDGVFVKRTGYRYYTPGCDSLPASGLYFTVTAKVKGTLRVGVHINKDQRKLFIVDRETMMPVSPSEVTVEGYLHNTSGTFRRSTDGNITYSDEYLIGSDDMGFARQFFGYVSFEAEAGRSYLLFCQNSQLGLYGLQFTPEGGSGSGGGEQQDEEPLPADRQGTTLASRFKMRVEPDLFQSLTDDISEIVMTDADGGQMQIVWKDASTERIAIDDVQEVTFAPVPTVSSLSTLQPVPDSYAGMADKSGSIKRFKYTAHTYKGNNSEVEKEANIYLPPGYDPHRCYDIFYLMHGGGNDITSYLQAPSLKNILDHMIDDGLIRPLIVVLPTFYGGNGDTGQYHQELVNDLMPQVEARYSTFALNTTKEELRRTRFHRAFGGFSMGSATTWNVFYRCLDYFAFFMPQSGDCWVANASQVASMVKQSGWQADDFFIYALTGSGDYAEPNLTNWMNSLRATGVFTEDEGGNTAYTVYPGGTHDLLYSKLYIYNVLPLFFK